MLIEEAVNSMYLVLLWISQLPPAATWLLPAGKSDHNGATWPAESAQLFPFASQLYSRNLTSFMALINDKGTLKIDMNDDILKGLASLIRVACSSQSGRGPRTSQCAS